MAVTASSLVNEGAHALRATSHRYRARHGTSQKRHGARGFDAVVRVPCGTAVRVAPLDEEGELDGGGGDGAHAFDEDDGYGGMIADPTFSKPQLGVVDGRIVVVPARTPEEQAAAAAEGKYERIDMA